MWAVNTVTRPTWGADVASAWLQSRILFCVSICIYASFSALSTSVHRVNKCDEQQLLYIAVAEGLDGCVSISKKLSSVTHVFMARNSAPARAAHPGAVDLRLWLA